MSVTRTCPICNRKKVFTDEETGREHKCAGCGFASHIHPDMSVSQQIRHAIGLFPAALNLALYVAINVCVGALVLVFIHYVLGKVFGGME